VVTGQDETVLIDLGDPALTHRIWLDETPLLRALQRRLETATSAGRDVLSSMRKQ
jgi:hypothetical protein